MADKLELKVVFSAIDKFLRPVNAITKGAKEASEALKLNTDRFKELNSTIGKIDAFKKVERESAITANSIKSTTAKIEELRKEISKVGVPTEEQIRKLARLKATSTELESATARLKNHEADLGAALRKAGVDTNNLANARGHLASASSSAQMMSQKLQNALDAENRKMQRLKAAQADMAKSKALAGKMAGTGARLMAGGAAIGATTAIPVAAYAVAEDAATQLRIAMMKKGGEVSEQFKEIDALASKLGNKLPGTTADFQNMMTMLIRQGMSVKSILGGLAEATAYLSVQLKMAPDAAAEFASKLQDATRTTDKDMMGLMDQIQKAYNVGVDSNNMLQAFSSLSSAMDVIKMKGLDGAKALAPLVAIMDQSSLVGESAGNALRKVFQRSLDLKKLGKANAELSGTGVKLEFSNGKGEFGGMDKLFQQMEKMKGLTTQKRNAAIKALYGDDDEVMKAVSIMMEKGKSGYLEMQQKMESQANIQERVNAQLSTLKSLWDAASGTFTNVLVAFGESIAPELHATAKLLGEVTERMQVWAKENPQVAAGLMKVVKWAGLAVLVLGGIVVALAAIAGPLAMAKFAMTTLGITVGGIAGGAFSLLLKGIGGIGTAMMWLGRIFMMNPIGLTITAIAAGAFLIYKYWDPIKEFFGGLWDQVKQAFNGGLSSIAALILNWSPIGLFYQAFASVMSYFGIELPGKFSEFGANLMNGLVRGITNGIQAAKDAIGTAGDAVVGYFKEKLGIHSPSRVFSDLGGFLMQGLGQGISGSAEGPLGVLAGLSKKVAGIGAGIAIAANAMAADIPNYRPPENPRLIEAAAHLPALPKLPDFPALTAPAFPAQTRRSDDIFTALPELRQLLAKFGDTPSTSDRPAKGISLDTRPPINPAASMRAMAREDRGNADSTTNAPMQVTIQIYGAPGQDTGAIQRQVEQAMANVEARRAAQLRSRLRDPE